MRPPIKASLLLLKNGSKHLGILVNPRTEEKLDVFGSGKFEIIGKLKDKGYDFSPIIKKLPKWVNKYIPNDYFLYAYCIVTSVPFTHPSDCECDDCRMIILQQHSGA